jgi:hypothetical protein
MQQAQLILLLTAQRSTYLKAADALGQAITAVEAVHPNPDDATVAVKGAAGDVSTLQGVAAPGALFPTSHGDPA